jgi:hypothetical protein
MAQGQHNPAVAYAMQTEAEGWLYVILSDGWAPGIGRSIMNAIAFNAPFLDERPLIQQIKADPEQVAADIEFFITNMGIPFR